ncbi:MAG: four helix bundle protein [Proteobacteria bacterium]|nr:four helix bundle protein [Pseudomonadota bacterium]
MRPHRRLDVWNKSIDFVINVYEMTKSFPKSEEFILTGQLRRAVVSITSNIAEGAGRQTKKEFIQFLHMAQGSASEVDTQLEIAYRLGYLTDAEKSNLENNLENISKMITGLQKSLKNSIR